MLKPVVDAFCLCCLVLCAAQTAAEPAVPVEQEPAHRLVLQNESIRVFEVWLAPGDDSLWHVHRHDGISVRLADATVEDQPQVGPAETFHLRRGAVAYGATPTARTHRVRNRGTTAFHNMYVELLADPDMGRDRPLVAASDRPAEFENDRVRALRRILAPGESTAMHTHASSGVAVAVTVGRLEISYPDRDARARDVKTGSVQWIDPGTTHSLRNVGDAPIEIVDIELK
jgi:quercetin dioxygenase-like cupin family protein